MKKALLLLSFFVCLSAVVNAQSKKYVLFEHFTQASCGPCAVQNPGFEVVRGENLGSTHHVAYHTSWPGVDPMNAINPTDVQTRVTYYNVGGVPAIHMLGSTWDGFPGGVSNGLIAANSSQSAPLRIKIEDSVLADGSHAVAVELIETGDVLGEDLRLRVAVVEKHIDYASAPGSNGERDFPNVFRKMISAAGGDAYTPSGAGTTQTFSFTFTEEAVYVSDELYVLAWLQDDTNKLIVNSGSSIDPKWQFINQTSEATVAGDGPHTFNAAYQSDAETEKLQVVLTTNAPAEWTSSITLNGNELNSGDTIELNSMLADVQLMVTPHSKGAIATYTVSVVSVDTPEDPVSSYTYTIISGVTDVILDHGGEATQWNVDYVQGLENAENNSYGILPLTDFKTVYEAGYLAEVKNIYDNVSWTFPGLQAEEVGVLADFLDNGGNLFVNGQDVGWDAFENTNNGANTEVREFYTNYLRANFITDGSAVFSMLNWDGDAIFGDPGSSSIINVYGGSNIYPDVFRPIDPAVALYHYNNVGLNIGAIRVEENDHKIVYVGVDMGMIADENVRHAIIEISHDWFNGSLSAVEYDNLIKEALGQSYPNPASEFTTIPLNNIEKDASIHLTDLTGKIIHTGAISVGQTSYKLLLNDFASGNYYYYLKTADGQSAPQSISIVR